MSQPEISNAATIIQFLVASITFCLALVNAFFFFILRGIKKNSDNIWSKVNENRKRCDSDHDRITRIEAENDVKNGKY